MADEEPEKKTYKIVYHNEDVLILYGSYLELKEILELISQGSVVLYKRIRSRVPSIEDYGIP